MKLEILYAAFILIPLGTFIAHVFDRHGRNKWGADMVGYLMVGAGLGCFVVWLVWVVVATAVKP